MAAVSAEDRAKTGIRVKGVPPEQRPYPVATKAQALSAIRLRHNNKHGISAARVLAHVARSKWGKDPEVKAVLERAREADRKRS